MQRVWMGVGLLSLAVLPATVDGAEGPLAGARGAERLEQRFAKDTILLVSVNDAAALKRAVEQTAVWATWHEPEVQRCLQPALDKAQKEIEKAIGLLPKDLLAALPGQVAVALGESRLVVGTRKADDILAYELTSPHNGNRNVLLVDGHVEMVTEEAFKKALARVPARLRAKEPKPGEIRPPASALAPHRGPVPGLGPPPSPEAPFRHLTPEVGCVTVGKDGLLFTSESFAAPIPPAAVPVAVAVFLPAVARGRGAARTMACANNLRNIGLAAFHYAAVNNDKTPASLDDLKPYLGGNGDPLKCPTTGKRYHFIDHSDRTMSQIRPDTILAYELAPGHMGRRNVLFADGHVEAMPEAKFGKLLEKVPARLRAKEPKPLK